MGNGLRYHSLDAMPDSLRARVQAQGKASPRQPADSREPRRDEEHQQQKAFFKLLADLAAADESYQRAVDRTYAIPNGGARSKAQAGKLKAEGVKSGVLDTFTSVARGGRHGLYLEFKSSTGQPSREQVKFLQEARVEGYGAAVVRTAAAAFALWKSYVDGEDICA